MFYTSNDVILCRNQIATFSVTEDYDTRCQSYGDKEIAARVRAIKEPGKMEWGQRRAAHYGYEIGVR